MNEAFCFQLEHLYSTCVSVVIRILADSFQVMTVCFVFWEFKMCSLWWTWNFGGDYKYQSSWKTLFNMPAVYNICKLFDPLYFNRLGSDPTEFSRSDFNAIIRSSSGEPLDQHLDIQPLWSYKCSFAWKNATNSAQWIVFETWSLNKYYSS